MNKLVAFSGLLASCLLFAGCTKEKSRNTQTEALFSAVRQGNTDMVRSLLSTPAVEVNVTDDRGSTPLLEAARFGHDEICRLLIAAGANFRSKDRDGNTALMLAIKNNHDDVVRVLKEAGETE